MAENPNDKALRDKLLSAEYAYDPDAWAEMEKLMDRPRRRGLLWWWLASGAVAIVLLVSAGVYMAAVYPGQQAKGGHVTSPPAIAGSTVAPAAPPAGGSTASIATLQYRAPATTPLPEQALAPQQDKKLVHTQAQVSSRAGSVHYGHDPGTGTLTRHTETGIAQHSNDQVSAPPLLYADDLEGPRMIAFDTNREERQIIGDDKGALTIPTHHRHRVTLSYALGAEAGVFASYTRKTFAGVPTWSAGLSQQLNIGKYFAITNSVLYSEVNLKVNNPVYPVNQYNDLRSYSAHIRELAIPVGIRIYPYSSRHLRVSVGVSYINHIKCSEAFTYQLTPKAPPATLIPVAVADFPATNSFGPTNGGNSFTANSSNNGQTYRSLMDYYSLGSGQRYYGSLMYTAGVDILLPYHISISAEPALRMSIGKIRMQDSRVLDPGFNTAVRYTF